MSLAQPVGESLPGMGELPAQAAASTLGGSERPFSVYLHVSYCRIRCDYCDFDTYTNLTMGQGASAEGFIGTLAGELCAAHRAVDSADLPVRAAQTVFAGGGTPTMLPAIDLVSMLELVRECFGLAADAEATTEADPDSVNEAGLEALTEGDFTRVSFGVQSATPHVLRVLERTHEPVRVSRVVEWVRRTDPSTSLNPIYGAPGEPLEDWQRSLDTVIRIGPDHVSTYTLVIEEGIRMWRQVHREELPMPEDGGEATKYEMADAALGQAGYECYGISSRARSGSECHRNQAYWLDWDWWGAGPGTHSHLGNIRLWNTKYPVVWVEQIAIGHLPMAEYEVIDAESCELERVMLGIRLREGVELMSLGNRPNCPSVDRPDRGRATPPHLVPIAAGLVGDGLLDAGAALRGRAVLTLRDCLTADIVTHTLIQ